MEFLLSQYHKSQFRFGAPLRSIKTGRRRASEGIADGEVEGQAIAQGKLVGQLCALHIVSNDLEVLILLFFLLVTLIEFLPNLVFLEGALVIHRCHG